jgi:predicted enzyme related to lactoylglutathione lyase
MANPFVHVELMATDVGKAKSFFGKLFAFDITIVNVPEALAWSDARYVEEISGWKIMATPLMQ